MKNYNITPKQSKYTKFFGIALALAALSLVFAAEQIIQPGYFFKSFVKAFAFLGAIAAYSFAAKKNIFDTVGLYKLKNFKTLAFPMILFFAGIVILFFAFKNQLDLTAIKQSLIQKENLTEENCIFVFAYIILCNSFLEEIFFRGFIFRLFTNKKLGAIFSGVLFSLYHIGIFITWFNPFIFALCLAGLTLAGLFLQWLGEKYQTIAAGYITHACANAAINIIGLLLIFDLIK